MTDVEGGSPPEASAPSPSSATISHNLAGQKLGRKGRVTRDRILAAAVELIEELGEEPITLSAIARRASLGMTSLYNYFSDLSEVVLAILEPVMATAQDEFVAIVREYWPDEALGELCRDFVESYHRFWARHTALLHLRNSMADQFDVRMMRQRVASTSPVIAHLQRQMDRDGTDPVAQATATALMTGTERSITLATDRRLHVLVGLGSPRNQAEVLVASARVMELAIADVRARLA